MSAKIAWERRLLCLHYGIKCYRGSMLASAVVAGMTAWHRLAGTWENRVSRYIALTEFARAKFIEGGLPKGKLS